MARTWLSVTVELLGGGGEDLWPWPGRVLAVAPSHTFEKLADAVNDAFGRWDRSHLSVFTLADGRVVTDEETGDEMATSPFGRITVPIDMRTAKPARLLALGDEFQYTFDLGDNWTHRCVVGDEKVDPMEVLGIQPAKPHAYFGWGTIPDQYGRRWAEDDDGDAPLPRRPKQPHPMRHRAWPAAEQHPELDLVQLRQAIAAADARRFLAAVAGADIDDALQQVGAGAAMALELEPRDAEPIVLSIINRLTWRRAPGDEVLAEDLLSRVRGEPPPGRLVEIDLEMLSMLVEGDRDFSTGCYVDLQTGDVYNDADTDAGMVGEDAAIDVEEDPDRWVWLENTGSGDGWRDMADFAERQRDASLRQRLERAIEGRGAFRRFRDVVHEAGLAEQWEVYATDRQMGRARDLLAEEGIRVG